MTNENTFHLKNGQMIKEQIEFKWDTTCGRSEIRVELPAGLNFGVNEMDHERKFGDHSPLT